MLPWLAGNGIEMVRGHTVVWPGRSNLPADVQRMLDARPVDTGALRARVNQHIAEVLAYTKGKVTEWDVLNEPYTNKDIQAALGEGEMAEWFKAARSADPDIKLYINDYNNIESGGYDLAHYNAYLRIIQSVLDAGGPVDGIGLQCHFGSHLTPPERALELLDRFAQFGKDLQVTEFDINIADEPTQAMYTRDFLTLCFSHPALKGFMIWGFWEGAHWLPRGAMIRRDWSTKPNFDAWNDLIFREWWTDVEGTTGDDGIFRTRGFLGDYEIEAGGEHPQTQKLRVLSPSEAAAITIAPAPQP
jgi:GH35 family endo-1,4-beta-xylanase